MVLILFFLILEIEAEANAIKVVAESLCPLDIVLDRVILTSTGVLLGCWQVCTLLSWEFFRTSCIANLVWSPLNLFIYLFLNGCLLCALPCKNFESLRNMIYYSIIYLLYLFCLLFSYNMKISPLVMILINQLTWLRKLLCAPNVLVCSVLL